MQAALNEADKTLYDLLMELPNLPDDRAPVGGKEANQVVHTWAASPTSARSLSIPSSCALAWA